MQPPTLLDDILGHIQSFLNFKDAAKSALLTTCLYDSWHNQKKLILDDRVFQNLHTFWFAAKKTIQRYSTFGLKIESLTIYISCGYERYYDCKKLLEEAGELGLVDLSINLSNDNFNFMIPFRVLTAPHLVKLSLIGGALHVDHELPHPSPSLKFLSLLPTRAIGYRGDFIHNIVCQCPSLVRLTCTGFLLWVNVERLGTGTHNLESLTVHNLDYNDNLYFNELIRFFKCLKNVSVCQVLNSDKLHICSESLEQVYICDRFRAVTAVLRVPKLKHLYYVGVSSSVITFESPESGWTSCVKVLCYVYDDFWFHSLRKLLQRLGGSKINLHVRMIYDSHGPVGSYSGDGAPISIELLEVVAISPNSHFIEGLFSVCLPKYLQYSPDSEMY